MKKVPPLTTTCIGSVPFLDVRDTLDLIARTSPTIPWWPQFPRRTQREDMVLQAVDGLPLLSVDEQAGTVLVRTDHKEEALTVFYEHFLSGDLDHLAVPTEAEVGFTALLERARSEPGFGPDFLKAQVIGPISFGTTIRTPEEKTLLDDPELSDAVIKGLGAKAAWLAGRIRETGRTPIVFIDEPGLTGFGSAFSTLTHDQVLGALNEVYDIVRESGDALLGTHVCGNTDWGLLTDTSVDVISFDAFGFLDSFLLYTDQVRRFLERGGYVAWGIVPTLEYTGTETAPQLAEKLIDGWAQLSARGVDPDLIRNQSWITPACGTGTLNETDARKVIELVPQVAGLVGNG